MHTIQFTEAAFERLYRQFMEQPVGLIKKKKHVIYIKSLNLKHYEIARIAQFSGDRVTDYLKEYDQGWLSGIGLLNIYRPVSSVTKSATVTA